MIRSVITNTRRSTRCAVARHLSTRGHERWSDRRFDAITAWFNAPDRKHAANLPIHSIQWGRLGCSHRRASALPSGSRLPTRPARRWLRRSRADALRRPPADRDRLVRSAPWRTDNQWPPWSRIDRLSISRQVAIVNPVHRDRHDSL